MDDIPPIPGNPQSDQGTQFITTPSKKKFGKGKGKTVGILIGLFLLLGGIAAGVLLVQQQQDIRERAKSTECACGIDSKTGNCKVCTGGTPGDCPCGLNAAGNACKSCSVSTETCKCGFTANGNCKSCSAEEESENSTIPACTVGQECEVPSTSSGASLCKLAGKNTYCCPPGILHSNGACSVSAKTGLPLCTAAGDCNVPANTSGATHCSVSSSPTTDTWCCPGIYSGGVCLGASGSGGTTSNGAGGDGGGGNASVSSNGSQSTSTSASAPTTAPTSASIAATTSTAPPVPETGSAMTTVVMLGVGVLAILGSLLFAF